MSGKSQVVTIGKKVISLIRQKCLLKYGSGLCNQQQVRRLTQFEDLQRCFQAKIAAQRYRRYSHAKQTLKEQIQWYQHVKILSELQAGNCGQMTVLAYTILCKIVPPGIKVEKRFTQDVKGDLHTCHSFTSVKPLSAVNDEQTLIIDPWPSNQIINPEVVSHKDHFGNKQNQRINMHYYKQPAQPLKERYMNFDFVRQNDFNLEFLNQVENFIDKKQLLDQPVWDYARNQKYPFDIYDIMADQQMWQKYRSRRRNVKSLTKNTKQK